MRYTEKDRKIFFEQNADALAKGLLGKILCRKLEDNTILRFRIIETEAYPYEDSACYGYKKTGESGSAFIRSRRNMLYLRRDAFDRMR